ncbi:Leukocyte elastase inhibitor [Trichinella spiralis]|uniref:Leukocyte elastase inhibitor n=1 Tax=Trichinella spiralis TaxID=6334 RepID=A0ABR3KQG5_TRISP
MSNCCSHGTLLHFSLQGSHLNICYYHQDLHQQRLRASSRSKLFKATLSRPSYPSQRSLHLFRKKRLVDSAGELLHTPWRIPTSMATVLLSISTNTFSGIS